VPKSIAGARPSVADRQEAAFERAMTAARVAEANRGQDVVVLDMRDATPIFDYFVVASGASRRQLHAMSEEIDHALEEGLGDRRLGIEGYAESRWILLDYGDVVIHLFDPETRDYYAIESLWGRAKRIPVKPK
jgi:ribosome-associated protein